MRALLAVLVLLSSCQRFLEFQTVTPGDADTTIDGPLDAPMCAVNPNVFTDTFMGATCGWGSIYSAGSASLQAVGGELVATLDAGSVETYIGCATNTTVPVDRVGVFVEIDRWETRPNGWTGIALKVDDTDVVQIEVSTNGTVLDLTNFDASIDYGDVVFEAQKMKFVRLRTSLVRDKYVADYSADAATWTRFADTGSAVPPVVVPDSAFLALEVGDNDGLSGSAAFSHLNACP